MLKSGSKHRILQTVENIVAKESLSCGRQKVKDESYIHCLAGRQLHKTLWPNCIVVTSFPPSTEQTEQIFVGCFTPAGPPGHKMSCSKASDLNPLFYSLKSFVCCLNPPLCLFLLQIFLLACPPCKTAMVVFRWARPCLLFYLIKRDVYFCSKHCGILFLALFSHHP